MEGTAFSSLNKVVGYSYLLFLLCGGTGLTGVIAAELISALFGLLFGTV